MSRSAQRLDGVVGEWGSADLNRSAEAPRFGAGAWATKKTTWKEFVRSHTEVLAAVGFFTVEVWTRAGLLTHYVLTFMRVASRQVCLAGFTTMPDAAWMEQMARNVTMADVGYLSGCRCLLHDRDANFCATFDALLEAVGIKVVKLPQRSPNLNESVSYCTLSVRFKTAPEPAAIADAV